MLTKGKCDFCLNYIYVGSQSIQLCWPLPTHIISSIYKIVGEREIKKRRQEKDHISRLEWTEKSEGKTHKKNEKKEGKVGGITQE